MLHKMKLWTDNPDGKMEVCSEDLSDFIWGAGSAYLTCDKKKLLGFISVVYPDLYRVIEVERIHVTVHMDDKGGNYLFLQTKIDGQYIIFCLFEVSDQMSAEELLNVYRNCFVMEDVYTRPFMPLIIFKSQDYYEQVQANLYQLPLEDALFINYYSVVMEKFSLTSFTQNYAESRHKKDAEIFEYSYEE